MYTGVTNDLKRRIHEHYNNRGKKKNFAGKYYCYKLIYCEYFADINQAIKREKEIKNMSRGNKEELINKKNPKWNFLKV